MCFDLEREFYVFRQDFPHSLFFFRTSIPWLTLFRLRLCCSG